MEAGGSEEETARAAQREEIFVRHLAVENSQAGIHIDPFIVVAGKKDA